MPCDGSTPNIETPWDALGDLRCDLAVAAPDIEDLFPSLEIEQGELLLGHRLLEARLPGIVARVPFRPGISPVSVATPSRQTAPRMMTSDYGITRRPRLVHEDRLRRLMIH